MRTVTFKSIFEGVARRGGLDPIDSTAWTAAIQAAVADYMTTWAKKAWEWEFFPEWTVIEQRAYRDAWNSATAYAAPTATTPVEVWYAPAQAYFQALQANTNQAPAVVVAGQWVANAPYWSLAATGYTYAAPYQQLVPPDYSANDWQPNTAYLASAPGAEVQVRNPADNRFYECITSHTSGSTFDATKWGILTTFERYVSLDQTGMTPIGEVRRVSRSNPRTSPRYPGVLTFTVDDKGILPAPMAGALVWVEFRLRPPRFTSTAYAGGTTYGVDDLVYDASASGDCYASLITSNTGNAPASNPAKWQKQNLPTLIADAVKWGAYGELLRNEGAGEKAERAEQEFYNQLSQASDVALASQGQYDRAAAAVY